jgi:HAD superfamily hydrolase (TIGR01662 family)
MAPRFDAVLFDLDNTLWHFNDAPPPRELAALFAPRIQAMVEGWGQQASIDYAELDLLLLEAEESALIRTMAADYREPDMEQVVVRELEHHGVTATREQARELRLAMWPDPTVLQPRLFDDVLETLEALRSRGLLLAAVTNRSHGAAVLAEELAHHGINDAFDAVVVAADIGWRKPHPAMVEHALAELQVSAERAVMIGDRVDRDIQAARAAGVTSVLARHPGMPKASIAGPHQQPDHQVRSMRELLDLID